MKQYSITAAAWLLAALFISPATFAGVIIQPVAASTDLGTSVGSPANVINQSGLLVGYTSGVTDFDDYYSSTQVITALITTRFGRRSLPSWAAISILISAAWC